MNNLSSSCLWLERGWRLRQLAERVPSFVVVQTLSKLWYLLWSQDRYPTTEEGMRISECITELAIKESIRREMRTIPPAMADLVPE